MSPREPEDDVVVMLQEEGAARRELGAKLMREERDALDEKLLGELSRTERRLRELEAKAAANGWALDKEALLYLHVLPLGHIHTRLTDDMRVYDAGCEGCTRYHRLNVDGRMIAPAISREEALNLLKENQR